MKGLFTWQLDHYFAHKNFSLWFCVIILQDALKYISIAKSAEIPQNNFSKWNIVIVNISIAYIANTKLKWTVKRTG